MLLNFKHSPRFAVFALAALAMIPLGCNPPAAVERPKTELPSNAVVPKYSYQIVNIWPHDSNAFTQGLILTDGKLLESTGQEGRSSLRSVELETGRVLKKVDVPPPYFAEGIALLKARSTSSRGNTRSALFTTRKRFERIGQFTYDGEGWGLATDGTSLLLSDGSNRIRFLDPTNFHVTKTITVLDGKIPVTELNELEYVSGEIYANVWHDDRIATIDPQTGRVTSWIDLTNLIPPSELEDPEAVLNGIAYDQANDKLYVTGKLWPRLFEIKVKRYKTSK